MSGRVLVLAELQAAKRRINLMPWRFFEGDAATPSRWAYLPDGDRPGEGWPVVLFLHGHGERAGNPDGRAPRGAGIGPAIEAHPERFRCIVVFPQCGGRWDPEARQQALRTLNATLEAIRAQYRHDPNRISLTGLSWGGFGAW